MFHCIYYIVLYHIISHYITLHCIVLYYIALHSIVLYCNALNCTVLCIVFYCIFLYCVVFHCIVLYCAMLRCRLYCTVLKINCLFRRHSVRQGIKQIIASKFIKTNSLPPHPPHTHTQPHTLPPPHSAHGWWDFLYFLYLLIKLSKYWEL